MEVIQQLENDLILLKEKQKVLSADLAKVENEIKQNTKAIYILKGQRIPQYIAKGKYKKKKVQVQDAQ